MNKTRKATEGNHLMAGKAVCVLGMAVLIAAMTGRAVAGDIRLADEGETRCVIVVTAGSMTWEGDDKQIDRWGRIAGLTALEVEAEAQRRLQRDSVRDLAHYLGKMSGTRIEIAEAPLGKERRVPIYVGAEAEKVFGPVGISKAARFGFRVVAGKQGFLVYG